MQSGRKGESAKLRDENEAANSSQREGPKRMIAAVPPSEVVGRRDEQRCWMLRAEVLAARPLSSGPLLPTLRPQRT